MQACVDWVLIIFGTQVIKKKRPVRPVFPDYPFLMTMLKPKKVTNKVDTPKSVDVVAAALCSSISELRDRHSQRQMAPQLPRSPDLIRFLTTIKSL